MYFNYLLEGSKTVEMCLKTMFLCTCHHLSHFSADFGGPYLNYVSIYKASKKRGFTDCSTEMSYVDYVEPGQPKKAPFVLRTGDQLSMFFKSESKSILLRVIQRIVQFEKGSVNIFNGKR